VSYEPVRWGILSTAHINRLVIPPAQESPMTDLVAVASRDQQKAEEYAR
jgi:D-xylose 1-dehydrogenase (NADP+, D-xylono-1,5-lactone-forming)